MIKSKYNRKLLTFRVLIVGFVLAVQKVPNISHIGAHDCCYIVLKTVKDIKKTIKNTDRKTNNYVFVFVL